MQDNQIIDHFDLEQMESSQLSAILRAETDKEVPDDDLVLQILHILEDREEDPAEPGGEKEKEAWQTFQSRARARKRKGMFVRKNLVKAASVALIAGLLLFALVPQNVDAESFWERLISWTDDFFAFFRSDSEEGFMLEDYEFITDNPGLKQVYDAVVEMGVTEPVVPMWIPEGYELVECTSVSVPVKKYVYARFLDGEKELGFQIHAFHTETPGMYFKDERDVIIVEKNGTTYNLARNNARWNVIWFIDNIECAIFIDCQEEVLYDIIASIYRWRISE